MTINVESLKELTEKLLEQRRNFRKVEGYKVNTLKSITFLYNSSKQWDFKFKIKFHLPTPLENEVLSYKPNKICTRSKHLKGKKSYIVLCTASLYIAFCQVENLLGFKNQVVEHLLQGFSPWNKPVHSYVLFNQIQYLCLETTVLETGDKKDSKRQFWLTWLRHQRGEGRVRWSQTAKKSIEWHLGLSSPGLTCLTFLSVSWKYRIRKATKTS